MTNGDALPRELRAVAATPPSVRGCEDLHACERRVLRALQRLRAQRFRMMHWWGTPQQGVGEPVGQS